MNKNMQYVEKTEYANVYLCAGNIRELKMGRMVHPLPSLHTNRYTCSIRHRSCLDPCPEPGLGIFCFSTYNTATSHF